MDHDTVNGQQAWVALCEKIDVSSREALRTERHKMNHNEMISGQDLTISSA